MPHPLVIALFDNASDAARAARTLREIGIPPARVSIIARSHDEEGALARVADASPGSEIEDSRVAGRLGELGAHLLAAIALIVPGIGPIVADGPLAAGLGEAAGHMAGGFARTMQHAGMARAEAERWETRVEGGAVLVGAHIDGEDVVAVREAMAGSNAAETALVTWK